MIDENRLVDLEREIGMEELRSVIGAFFEEGAETIAGLAIAIESGLTAERLRLLHLLKGSARILGADRLADLAAGLEVRPTPPDAADLAGMEVEFALVRDELSAWAASRRR